MYKTMFRDSLRFVHARCRRDNLCRQNAPKGRTFCAVLVDVGQPRCSGKRSKQSPELERDSAPFDLGGWERRRGYAYDVAANLGEGLPVEGTSHKETT